MDVRTTVAGSLPKPDWLAEPEKLWAGWRLEGGALWDGQCRAAREWIEHQDASGIGIVSDGEQFRRHFVHGFLEEIDGIDWDLMTPMGIRADRYVAQVPTVTGPVARKGSVHGRSTAFCRSIAPKSLKMTLPGPMTICDTIADAHYGSRPEMAMAFAKLLNEEARELDALGVDVIQFDEPAFNAFTREAADWGVEALHRAIEGLSCTTAVHICYGYGIQANIDWKATLGTEWRQYADFFPALNASRIDQVSLECANARVPLNLIGLLPDKDVLVGAIDVASLTAETPAEVAATLRAASEFVDPSRIVACTNCGLAPLPMEVSRAKIAALGAGVALFGEELGGGGG